MNTDKLIEAIEAKKYLPEQGIDAEMESFNQGLDAAIESLRDPALSLLPGEPVAWLWEHPSFGKELMFNEPRTTIDARRWTCRPLYTSPTPHPSLDREGLLEEARRVLTEARAALDGEPEYHYSGMGCGLEDRNIHDRYDAMHHGWECALERAYGEHVIPAREAIDAFILKLEGSSHGKA